MFRFRRKHRELNERTEQARGEVGESRESLHRSTEEVVKPLRKLAAENRFAALIRDSLMGGGAR